MTLYTKYRYTNFLNILKYCCFCLLQIKLIGIIAAIGLVIVNIPTVECLYLDDVDNDDLYSSESRKFPRRQKHFGGEGFGGHPILIVFGGGRGR